MLMLIYDLFYSNLTMKSFHLFVIRYLDFKRD